MTTFSLYHKDLFLNILNYLEYRNRIDRLLRLQFKSSQTTKSLSIPDLLNPSPHGVHQR
jgi:hypothetical protein